MIKTNHFFIPYVGNKRGEVETIEKFISSNTDINKITTIIEPYCGSSSFSFYMSCKYPKKFKYVLNDNDTNLIELYQIFKDENKLRAFLEELKLLCVDLDKTKYLKIIKELNIKSWFLTRYIFTIRPGLFPIDGREKSKIANIDKLLNVPIINFLRTENIEFKNIDGIELYNTYKNDKTNLIFLDPPYLVSCNDLYSDKCNTNIYEYLFYNKIEKEKAIVCLCLENNWIIKLLFKGYKSELKQKLYQQTKKKTEHITIINKLEK